MSSKEQIRDMLIQGVSPVQVSNALGLTESYVSQLLGNEDFSAEVQAGKVALLAEDVAYDEKIQRVEESYLDRIEEKSKFANLQQSLQAFKILNGAKKRRDAHTASQTPGVGVIVNIQLPDAIIPSYVTNSKNEIVEVQGQTMVSATPKSVEAASQARLPPASKEQRAVEILQNLHLRPVQRITRSVKDSQLADLL